MIKRILIKFLQIGACLSLLAFSGVASAASGCEGDQKIEGGPPHTYSPGTTISEVCIKAGRNVTTYMCGEGDPTDGCYNLSWNSDCTAVQISGGGTSRSCKAISHTAAEFGEPPKCEPTPEVCDGIDNDCDGAIDEGDVCKPEPPTCDKNDPKCEEPPK